MGQSNSIEKDESSEPWLGSKDMKATINTTLTPSELRWVGGEFVYFMDIPFADSRQSTRSNLAPVRPLIVGLLENVMNRTIPDDYLVAQPTRDDRQVLSGDRLSQLIVPWAHHLCRATSSDEVSFKQWGEKVTQSLVKACSAVEREVYARIGSLMDHQTADAAFLCALLTFLSSLGKCVRAIWKDDEALSVLEQRSQMYRETVDIFQGNLLETWGDQYRAATCQLGGGFPFLAYTLTCQPTENKVLSVDTESYEPQHGKPSCSCTFVKPSVAEVVALLAKDEVPVLLFDGEEFVVRSAAVGPYVAISHVWADGLGSTTEVGLPRCQVERLAAIARKLVPDGAFWVDALCVPSAPSSRRHAIVLMAHTYEQADKVLVIDGGVRTQCSLSSTKEELLLRIATSGWMQRIWTLQEGMLARELLFEVSDGIIDCSFFNGDVFSTAQSLIPIFQHRPRDDAAREFIPRAGKPARCTVNELVALLRYRSTSKPEDEPIAISGLLGVDTAKLVRLKSGEERMKALLMQVGTLNRQMGVHGWFCDRLTLPGFTWAPTSLSEVLWPGDPVDPLIATCTEEGLLADYYVVHFMPVRLAINYGIVAVVGVGGATDLSSDSGEGGGKQESGACTQCGTARDTSPTGRVFNLILSPFLFRVRNLASVAVNAIVIKTPLGSNALRDEGVAVVWIDTDELKVPVSEAPLKCEFVASGSASFGFPDTVETTRTRNYWAHVQATAMPCRKICLK